jgi:hypothetical protein
MVRIEETRPGGIIRALIPAAGPTSNRVIGYAVPLGDGRYLVRLPHSIAAPFDCRGEALAALRSLRPESAT